MLDTCLQATMRTVVLGGALLVAGCVITADGVFFDQSDFVQPDNVTGSWIQAPPANEDPVGMRIGALPNGMLRAVAILATGELVSNEEPEDFSLVDIGGGDYLVVQVENEGGRPLSSFIGLSTSGRSLTFMLFGPGDDDAANRRLATVFEEHELAMDPGEEYVAHLQGDVTKEKIVTIFRELMSSPGRYAAITTTYNRLDLN